MTQSGSPASVTDTLSTLIGTSAVTGNCLRVNDLEYKDSCCVAAENNCSLLGSIQTQSSKSLPVVGAEAGAIFTV